MACVYSIASEFGCDIGIDMFWALRTTIVYCGMKAIWHTMIGVVGIFRFTSKESMTMLASCFLPANEADLKFPSCVERSIRHSGRMESLWQMKDIWAPSSQRWGQRSASGE